MKVDLKNEYSWTQDVWGGGLYLNIRPVPIHTLLQKVAVMYPKTVCLFANNHNTIEEEDRVARSRALGKIRVASVEGLNRIRSGHVVRGAAE